MSTGSGATTEIRYTGGHVIDGLYHFGARFYDPDNARFTQQDPLNAPGDLKSANRYLYTGGDPINIVDPAGTFGIADVVNIGSMVAGIGCRRRCLWCWLRLGRIRQWGNRRLRFRWGRRLSIGTRRRWRVSHRGSLPRDRRSAQYWDQEPDRWYDGR